MGLLNKIFSHKKEQVDAGKQELSAKPIGLGLADPNHPARQLIDNASRHADNAIKLSVFSDGSWMSEGNTIDVLPLVSIIDDALKIAHDDLDLMVAKSGALCCAMQFKSAEDEIDKVLSINPQHFEAMQRKAYWKEWRPLFQYPSWSVSNKILHPIMEYGKNEAGLSIQLIRDGLQIGIAIIVPARRQDFPKGISNSINSKWEPIWADTPHGSLVAHYTVVKDSPVDPWRQECFLAISHKKDVSPADGYWLIQRLRHSGSCFIVLSDGNEVLYNSRYIFPNSLKSNLQLIADKYEKKSTKEQSPTEFSKAQEWHMNHFDMGKIN